MLLGDEPAVFVERSTPNQEGARARATAQPGCLEIEEDEWHPGAAGQHRGRRRRASRAICQIADRASTVAIGCRDSSRDDEGSALFVMQPGSAQGLRERDIVGVPPG